MATAPVAATLPLLKEAELMERHGSGRGGGWVDHGVAGPTAAFLAPDLGALRG